jgi:hypothetical protein
MAIQTLYPNQKPSLLLDFANVKALDPRITFTRTTTATYYNGVTTAKAEENLLLRSEQFNTAWSLSATSVTADTTTAPNGTITADTLTASAGNASHAIIQFTAPPVGRNVFSVFAKEGTAKYIQFLFGGQTGTFANFDLTSGAGTTGTSAGIVSSSIVDFGGGWYRCIVIFDSTSATNVQISIVDSSSALRGSFFNAAGTETVFLWGAQLEQRSAVTDYTPTTTQPITNYIPVLLTAASGVARFDHNPTTGESLGLLVEEQRTNLFERSDDFDNAYWTKARSSIESNVIVAPDGTLTGDKLVDNTDNNTHVVQRNVTLTDNLDYSFSCYIKAGERSIVRLQAVNKANTACVAYFNLLTGVVSNASNATGSMTLVGNGWYRCVLVFNASTGATSPITIISPTTVAGTTFYIGDGYSGIFIWGAQLEAGDSTTSYIPTVAATVTRNADAASMTGANFSSWFNNAEGTLYAEAAGVDAAGDRIALSISDGTFNNSNYITFPNSIDAISLASINGGSGQVTGTSTASGSFVGKTFYKVSAVLKTNDFAICVNGATVLTDTLGTPPISNRLFIGAGWSGTANFLNGHIRKLSYYPIRATNAQLQALTT